MPAVKLDQLKLQSANLAGKFSRPELFVSMLQELLNQYSNRTFRLQASTGRLKPTPSYHVPQTVIRQVERDVLAQLKVHTQQQALDLADALWLSQSLEEKTLAVTLLGAAAANPPEPLISRFRQWYQSGVDQLLDQRLAVFGSRSLRRDAVTEWHALTAEWIVSRRTPSLANLVAVAEDDLATQGDACFSGAFDMLSTLLETNDLAVLPDLLRLLTTLIRLSPMETAFFIRSRIAVLDRRNTLTERFMARSPDLFPEDMRAGIREAIQPRRQ